MPDRLKNLQLTPAQIQTNARLIHTITQLSLYKTTITTIDQTLHQLQAAQDSNVQKRLHSAIRQWHKHKHWFRYADRTKRRYLKRVFGLESNSQYVIECTPLAIVVTLPKQEYVMATHHYDSNGITVQRDGFIFIFVHTGGYNQPSRPAKAVLQTRRHELSHAVFNLCAGHCQPRFFSDVFTRVRRAKLNPRRHLLFSEMMCREHMQDAHSEFFAYAANHTYDLNLDAYSKGDWKARLTLVNIALCNLPTTVTQRRRLYMIYVMQYRRYLKSLGRYQSYIYWLRDHHPVQKNWSAALLAMIALSPVEIIAGLTVQHKPTRLYDQLQVELSSSAIRFQAQPVAWKIERLLTRHHQMPHPALILPLVKQLTLSDETGWHFLSALLKRYIAHTNLAGEDYVQLLHYVLRYCPVSAVKDYAVLLLYCLIIDKKLSPAAVQASQAYCRHLNKQLSKRDFLRQKIKHLIL